MKMKIGTIILIITLSIWFLFGSIEIKFVLLNFGLLYRFYTYDKSFLTFMYMLVVSILYLNPILIGEYFQVYHPKHYFLEENSLIVSLTYLLLYNLVLFLTYFVLTKRNKQPYQFLFYNYKNRKQSVTKIISGVLLLVAISLGAKYYLYSHGAFRMLGEVKGTPLLQLFKALSVFNIIAILLLGYFIKNNILKEKKHKLLYLGVSLLSLILAVLTASRGQIIFLIIIYFYIHIDLIRRHVFKSLVGVFVFLFLSIMLFPIVGYYRINDVTFSEAIVHIVKNLDNISLVFLDVLSTRLNYITILSRCIDYYSEIGEIVFHYHQNLTGLIPRLIWPGKPIIGLDFNLIGTKLGFVSANDTMTAVGLGVYGEAFFQLKYFGIFIGMFHGFLFYFINKFRVNTPSAFTLYFLLVLFIVSKDGFIAVIPGIIWVIFPAIFLLYLFNIKRVTKI